MCVSPHSDIPFMTNVNDRPDRWVIARRVYECAALAPGDLASLMRVSPKTLLKRARGECWAAPKPVGEGVREADARWAEARDVLAQCRAELAAQVAMFRDAPEDRSAADAAAEKNARTLQMMLRNFEKLSELTEQAEDQMAGGVTDRDSQLPAFRAELARRVEALDAGPCR